MGISKINGDKIELWWSFSTQRKRPHSQTCVGWSLLRIFLHQSLSVFEHASFFLYSIQMCKTTTYEKTASSKLFTALLRQAQFAPVPTQIDCIKLSKMYKLCQNYFQRRRVPTSVLRDEEKSSRHSFLFEEMDSFLAYSLLPFLTWKERLWRSTKTYFTCNWYHLLLEPSMWSHI